MWQPTRCPVEARAAKTPYRSALNLEKHVVSKHARSMQDARDIIAACGYIFRDNRREVLMCGRPRVRLAFAGLPMVPILPAFLL